MEALKERLRLMEEYLDLTQQQADAIAEDDHDKLLAGLKKRDELIAAVNALKIEEAGAGSEEIIARTKSVAAAISKLDEKNAEGVRAMMSATSDEGKKITKSREGIGKYTQKDFQYGPGFINELK